MQSLVKASLLEQSTMLTLQEVLMMASSVAAIRILPRVKIIIAALSMACNFTNRGHEMANAAVVALASFAYALVSLALAYVLGLISRF